jgi:uncharacterized spore protein YtfJ
MKADEITAQAKHIFGEPYAQNGITIIPAAKVWLGGGGGGGEKADDESHGSGSGFGLIARPVGAFVIKGEEVEWKPAIDVNRAILGGQIVAVIALITLRALLRRMANR